MAQQVYKVPRLNDSQIAAALTALSEEFGGFSMGIQVLDAGLGSVTFPEAANEHWRNLLAHNGDLINHFGGTINGVSIGYYRGGLQGQSFEKSPIFDDITIDTQGFDPQRLDIAARCLQLFRPVQLPRPSDPIALLDSQRAIQESTFGRLERQLEQVFSQTIELRGQLDEQVRQREAALQKQFDERTAIAETEQATSKKKLEQEQEALDARRKQLDDSDNTFARRQIRDRMLGDVASRVQNFGVSATTSAARRPVAFGMSVLAAFLLMLFLWTAAELWETRASAVVSTSRSINVASTPAAGITAAVPPTSASQAKVEVQIPSAYPTNSGSLPNERLMLWVRLTLVSLGFAASVIYYIKWQNQWAGTFASTEQALQQFHIDVNRANWVVETCLEWRKETQSDLPAPLVESLTRGLFAGRDSQTQVLHPADELASALMGSASKLSLDLGGSKVEIDKPKSIPKSVSSATKSGE